jgi:hypothetical protein
MEYTVGWTRAPVQSKCDARRHLHLWDLLSGPIRYAGSYRSDDNYKNMRSHSSFIKNPKVKMLALDSLSGQWRNFAKNRTWYTVPRSIVHTNAQEPFKIQIPPRPRQALQNIAGRGNRIHPQAGRRRHPPPHALLPAPRRPRCAARRRRRTPRPTAAPAASAPPTTWTRATRARPLPRPRPPRFPAASTTTLRRRRRRRRSDLALRHENRPPPLAAAAAANLAAANLAAANLAAANLAAALLLRRAL